MLSPGGGVRAWGGDSPIFHCPWVGHSPLSSTPGGGRFHRYQISEGVSSSSKWCQLVSKRIFIAQREYSAEKKSYESSFFSKTFLQLKSYVILGIFHVPGGGDSLHYSTIFLCPTHGHSTIFLEKKSNPRPLPAPPSRA